MLKMVDKLMSANNIVFYVTQMCNIYCWHCYNDAGGSTETHSKTVLGIAEKIKNGRFNYVSISGGEPLCEPNLSISVANILKREGRRVALLSNGLLIHDKNIIKLKDAFTDFQISIDMPEEAYASCFKGCKGYRERMGKVIKLLDESNISVVYTHVPNIHNHKIDEYFESFFYPGVKALRCQFPYERGRASGKNDVMLDEIGICEYIDALNRIKDKYKIEITVFFPSNATKGDYYINYLGDVYNGIFGSSYCGRIE